MKSKIMYFSLHISHYCEGGQRSMGALEVPNIK
jgi:hypothetical protein